MQSAEWQRDNYIVNRDSAYANLHYAVQKLMGGNKRFEQSRSIHPRQKPALYMAAASCFERSEICFETDSGDHHACFQKSVSTFLTWLFKPLPQEELTFFSG